MDKLEEDWNGLQLQFLKNASLKPPANGHNIVGQQQILRLFAHPVACCCVLLGVVAAQSLKPVKLLATWKRTQQLQQCWELLRPFQTMLWEKKFYWYEAVISIFPSHKTSLTLSCFANKGALTESFRFEYEIWLEIFRVFSKYRLPGKLDFIISHQKR